MFDLIFRVGPNLINIHRTALSSPKVLLVPYATHHVPTYHTWMQDVDLQAATASEPLSLDEEYSMQRSWRNDHDKLTFIICLPLDTTSSQTPTCRSGSHDKPENMIGDINLFLVEDEDVDENVNDDARVVGEIELMIARSNFRRQGYGQAAIQAFMSYILTNWTDISREYGQVKKESSSRIPALAFLRVKINQTNIGSIHVFESHGFQRIKDGVNYFGEIELRWRLGSAESKNEISRGTYDVLEYNDQPQHRTQPPEPINS